VGRILHVGEIVPSPTAQAKAVRLPGAGVLEW
jgi:hypothetical protein